MIRLAGAVAALSLVFAGIAPALSRTGAPLQPPHGFDLSLIDTSCKACDDFRRFATGKYAQLHKIPPDKSSTGSFDDLYERNLAVLRGIAEDASHAAAPAATVEQQVGDFYAACMDTDTIAAAGITPLNATLAIVDGIASRSDLPAAVARLQLQGFGVLFTANAEQDDKNATAYVLALEQGGLGLPDRDYYLKTDPASVKIRAQYVAYMQRIFVLDGATPPQARAASAKVMAFETALARVSSTNVALRDPVANYHRVALPALEAATPTFRFAAFLNGVGLARIPTAIVRQPAFFRGLNTLLGSTSLQTIKTDLRWQILSANGLVLPARFDDADFAFQAVLNGTKVQRPRWKRCIDATDGAVGEALGRLYVAKAFTPEAKAKVLSLVRNLKAVLRSDMTTLTWMSPQTRRRAIAKLDAYGLKIGYPSKWRTYTFAVDRTTPYADQIAADIFERKREFAKIGKPLDPTEFDMTPPTVNAYYDPNRNEIVFPAGILQPPFYDPNADDAYNYGAIGAIMGHEMTHGFDDQGSQYDLHGNLRPWWTPADRARFERRASCVADYMSTLTVLPGVKQTGKLVEGEAIADLGGLTIAYRAYQLEQALHPSAQLDGYTPNQRFFLGFAQAFASDERPALLRLLANTDPHPADKNRVDGTLANMPQFATAWHCPMNAPMVRPPASRCQIW